MVILGRKKFGVNENRLNGTHKGCLDRGLPKVLSPQKKLNQEAMTLPLTCKFAECLVVPAGFFATQTYSPECSALAESMLSWLIRLLVRITETPPYFSTSFPFKVHVILTGRSPLLTVQVSEDISPELMGSSKNSKGIIWGGTEKGSHAGVYRLR